MKPNGHLEIKDIAEDILEDSVEGVDPLTLIEEGSEVPGLKAKFREAQNVTNRIRRIRTCPGANDVFSEFAKDAAEGKVLEMFFAGTSSDRQRAQESILDRALGKPVDRQITANVNINSMSEGELDAAIANKLTKLGLGGEATVATRFAEPRIPEGFKTPPDVGATPWGSNRVYPEFGEDSSPHGGEPIGEDPHRSVGSGELGVGVSPVEENFSS